MSKYSLRTNFSLNLIIQIVIVVGVWAKVNTIICVTPDGRDTCDQKIESRRLNTTSLVSIQEASHSFLDISYRISCSYQIWSVWMMHDESFQQCFLTKQYTFFAIVVKSCSNHIHHLDIVSVKMKCSQLCLVKV